MSTGLEARERSRAWNRRFSIAPSGNRVAVTLRPDRLAQEGTRCMRVFTTHCARWPRTRTHRGLSGRYSPGERCPDRYLGLRPHTRRWARMDQRTEHTPRMLDVLREGSDSFLTTRADAVLNWARKYSMFAYPFVTACCGMEFMSAWGPRYDVTRFGYEVPRFSPRQADLLWVVGTISHRLGPVLKKVYDQMAEPKWVIAFGACTCSGGPYNNYAVVQGIDTLVPVDVYIPGCPPRPEAVLDAVMKLQLRVQAEKVPATGRHRETGELPLPVVEKPVP